MKFYDGNDCGEGTHEIKVTLQYGEYRGSFTYNMGGNCRGLGVLDFSPECEIDEDFCENVKCEDLNIEITEDDEVYVAFKKEDKIVSADYFDLSDFENLIVGIEIIGYREEGDDDGD